VNLNPSWIWRLLPDPTIGLSAAISGMVHPQPNVVPLEGSLPRGAIVDDNLWRIL
jgi:hypothetical protein